MRWSIPVLILLATGGAIGWIHFGDVLFKPQLTAAVLILTALLLALWFILLTGFPLPRRLAMLGGLGAVLFGLYFVLKNYTRFEGSFTGDGFPKLAWKWSPRADEVLVPGFSLSASAARTLPLEDEHSKRPAFPEFLGPGRSNVLHGLWLSKAWDTTPPREIWRRAVGAGWSSFAVLGGRAITQEQRGENELTVCYQLADGEVLWAHTNTVRFSEALGGDGPRATPTIDGNRVYALGATGLLDALELGTGRKLWSRDTLEEANARNLEWGKSSAPLVTGDLVIVSGGESGPLLLAYDKITGEPKWRGGNGTSSYASPIARALAGLEQILSVNAAGVTGHDVKTGAVLWDYPWPGSFPKCAQPVVIATNQLFLTAGYGVGSVLLTLSPGDDDRLVAVEVWRNLAMKARFATVAVKDGFIYGLDEGILACVDLKTGARRWKGGRYGHGQLLLVEDVLLIQTEGGDIALVEASPEQAREIARHPALRGKTWNTPALAGDFLLVRNDREAACFRLPLRQPASGEK